MCTLTINTDVIYVINALDIRLVLLDLHRYAYGSARSTHLHIGKGTVLLPMGD
ncbi:hypothetical protein APHCR_0771 [Anaplasma phagocytophilum str. CR1007]|nr:hypothetical protein APHHGE2_0028 [Anaplasma phagocytophilum str. HGE2]KJZ99334.1 hypothetical protein APHCR_0771 [Anaplasma phagocytophilum str. CR1007]KJZ99781.1 hypothetical protein APHDU1_0563 [Anaplasma phagocytophilum]